MMSHMPSSLGTARMGPVPISPGILALITSPCSTPLIPDQVVMNPDVFVTALEANGATLYFSTLLAGSRSDYGRAIRLDDLGNVWVTGYTYSCDFVPDSPPYTPFQEHPNLREVCPGGTWCCVIGADAFLAEVMYDETVPATTLEYCTYISGYDDDKGYALTFDADGDPVVAGTTGSPNFPMVNPYQGNLQGYTDAFVTVLDIGDLSQAFLHVLRRERGRGGTGSRHCEQQDRNRRDNGLSRPPCGECLPGVPRRGEGRVPHNIQRG